MDLIDYLTQLSNRIPKLLDSIQTEEATKNALIMPFIQALGYNVFDPFEVVPEFTADVGTKKGEKIDYVIMIEGKPAILIECKSCGTNLNINHASQLFRYFGVVEARFAVLTNGIEYKFFTDIEAPNKMDDKPFFEFSMMNVDVRTADEVKKFAKSLFDMENILSNASELKYKKQIRALMSDELEKPSDEFVRIFAKQVYSGSLTPARMEQFADLVEQAFKEWVKDKVSERLQSALDGVPKGGVGDMARTQEQLNQENLAEEKKNIKSDDGIITTEEELESFRIVRAILAKEIDPKRVFMRDTKSYCGILLDDNNRKPICRLHYTVNQMSIILLDKERKEKRFLIESPVDIYQHAEEIIENAKQYL
ncbi:MAG: type I restriction endonuclease [Akkermansia sp.]